MRQIIFTEFDLIISTEVSDVFKWFGVNSLAGFTFAESKFMDQHNEGFDSMVNYHPQDKENELKSKPFMFLNSKALSNKPIHESTLIVHHASMKMSRILMEGSDVDYDKIYNFGEAICLDVLDELNFPEVFHRV